MPSEKRTRRGVCTICTGQCTDEGHGFYHDDRPLGTVRGLPPHFAKVSPATIVFAPSDFIDAVTEAGRHMGLVGEAM